MIDAPKFPRRRSERRRGAAESLWRRNAEARQGLARRGGMITAVLLALTVGCGGPSKPTPSPAPVPPPVTPAGAPDDQAHGESGGTEQAPDFAATIPLPTPMTLPVREVRSAQSVGAWRDDAQGTASLRLTVDACHFDEAEPDADLTAASPGACRATNERSLASRQQRVLAIPPGPIELTVRNEHVPFDLGFWLRSADDPRETLVSAGGLAVGSEHSWSLELTPGFYVYSDPLGPTPDYLLLVDAEQAR